MDRRGFLGWFSAAGLGLLAHHRPGHNGGPVPTTTVASTTTLPAPTTTTLGPTTTTTLPGGADPYHDLYSDLYEVA